MQKTKKKTAKKTTKTHPVCPVCPVCGGPAPEPPARCPVCTAERIRVGGDDEDVTDAPTLVRLRGTMARPPEAAEPAASADPDRSPLDDFFLGVPGVDAVRVRATETTRMLVPLAIRCDGVSNGETLEVLGEAVPAFGDRGRSPAAAPGLDVALRARIVAAGPDASRHLTHAIAAMSEASHRGPPRSPELVPIPRGLTLAHREQQPGRWQLRLVNRWYSGWYLFLLVLVPVMLGCMSFALHSSGQGKVIPVLVMAAAIAAYYLLTLVVNRSVVTVDADHLSVRHGPLPMAKIRGDNRVIPVGRVARIYAVKQGDTCTVEVQLENEGSPTAEPAHVALLAVEEDDVRAFLIGRLIEAALGLPHRAVAGEHRPLEEEEIPDLQAWLGMRSSSDRGKESAAIEGAERDGDAGPPPRGVRVLRLEGPDGPELLVSLPCSTFIYPLFGLGLACPIWMVSTGWDDLFTVVFPWFLLNVLALVVCPVFAYTLLTGLVNRTFVLVTPRGLRIWHAPLPWRRGRAFPAPEIEQLFLGAVQHVARSGWFETYNLLLALRSGRQVRLLKGAHPFARLRWLERTVERELGIPDRRVRGECYDHGGEADDAD